MRLSGRLAFDLFLLAVVAGGAVMALSYEARAGRIPFLVAVVAAGLLLAQVGLDLRPPSATAEPEGGNGRTGWRYPAYAAAAYAGFVFLVWLVGYLIAVPLFTYGSMTLLGRTGWKLALAVTAGVWAFVYLLLEVLLRANLG